MSRQTESSLFIVSPFERTKFYQPLLRGITTYQELGSRIHEKIRTAHAFNQMERVRELARMLVNIPIREYQLIGQYYLVWCKCREREYQSEALERIAEQSETYKAKALISRAAFEVYQGSPERALYFYAEALKANPTVSDFIKASTGIATVKATEGYHASALRDIETLLPLLCHAEPLTYFQMMNSYATELIEDNRLSEAENAILIAVSSPLGPFDPEWRNTLSEVRSKQKRCSTVTISRPQIEPYEPEIELPGLAQARVEAAIDFIKENLHRHITLAELAKMVNLSVSQFTDIFKIETGHTPIDYVIGLKMEKASHLLTTTFLSVKEVIAAVGYDKTAFGRQFKKRFDASPSEYRNRKLRRR